MKNNQGYKNEALAALKGNWAPAVVCSIVLLLLMCILVGPSYCANMTALGMFHFPAGLVQAFTWASYPLNIFLFYPLLLGGVVTFNLLLAEGDAALTSNMFKAMFSGYFRNVWGLFLMFLFIVLWTLLLIIPGIVKGFAYFMTPYILKDYPELSANQAINLSCRMMKGHKFDLFWLNLSFVGWFLLATFTLGIGYVWLIPYVQTANAAFYQDVKKAYEQNNLNN